MGRAHTAQAAYDAAKEERPDLILLDLYLPDQHGLELLRRMRSLPEPPDVIIITAARDVASVRSSMRLGALHYLVKPFTFDRLAEQLRSYQSWRASAPAEAEASQDDVDRLYDLMRPSRQGGAAGSGSKATPGSTATLIAETLGSLADPVTVQEIADRAGISRATAQRYLSELVDQGIVQRHPQYGTPGRPVYLYSRAR